MNPREGSAGRMPSTCFGIPSSEYVEGVMISTYVLDDSKWVLYNARDEECALARQVANADHEIQVSEGTVGFVTSMEPRDDDDSDIGTVCELASAADVAELRRLVLIKKFSMFHS